MPGDMRAFWVALSTPKRKLRRDFTPRPSALLIRSLAHKEGHDSL